MTLCINCGTELKLKTAKRCRPCYDETRDKGGYHLTKMGYLRNNQTRKMQHREVMEKHLKRELGAKEFVHHINHVKTDNRIENLQLIDQPSHVKHHKPQLANYARHPVYGYFIKKDKEDYTPHFEKRKREKDGRFG